MDAWVLIWPIPPSFHSLGFLIQTDLLIRKLPFMRLVR